MVQFAIEHHLGSSKEIDSTLKQIDEDERVGCDDCFVFGHLQLTLG